MPSAIELEGYLTSKGSWKRSGVEWIGVCPVCRGGQSGERCVSVNVETGQWVCNRKNNCGASGGWSALQEAYGDKPAYKAPLLNLPVKVYSQAKANARALKDDGRRFLNERGLTDLTIDGWRVGQHVCWFKKAAAEVTGLAWPVYDDANKLVNVKSRALSVKDFANQKGCAQWPVGLHLVDTNIHGKAVTFCEGEIDAMTLWQYGRGNVCSLPNGAGDQTWIELAWEWLSGFKEIYLCLDADKAGQDALDKITQRLGYQWIVKVVTLPGGHKDANECLMAGVSRDAIAAAFANAKELSPDTVHAADHYVDQVWERLANRHKMTGFASGFSQLDEITHGFRSGELSLWTGQSGSGKSTVLAQIAVNTLRNGIKTCIASLEIPPEAYLAWMVLQASGLEQPTRNDSDRVIKWLGTGFQMVHRVTSSSLDDLLSDWAYCAQRHGCKQFIVDPLQLIDAGADEYAAQAKVINALVRFARQYSCHVHLVAHPKKLESDTAQLGQNAVKGNKAITDLAHNIFAIVRGNDAAAIQVIKVREYSSAPNATVGINVDPRTKQMWGTTKPNFWPWINAANETEDDIPEWTDDPPHKGLMDYDEPLTTIYGSGR